MQQNWRIDTLTCNMIVLFKMLNNFFKRIKACSPLAQTTLILVHLDFRGGPSSIKTPDTGICEN